METTMTNFGEITLAISLNAASAAALFHCSHLALMLSCCAIFSGLFTQHLAIWGLISLIFSALGGFLFYRYDLRRGYRLIAALCVWIVCMFFYLHLVPGFANWLWIDRWQLASDSTPYNSYINLDKGLIGIALLALSPRNQGALKDLQPLNLDLAAKVGICCTTIAVVIGIAYVGSAVRFDLKLPPFFPLWLVQNCLLVVVPEEALFRGFLQCELARFCVYWPFGRFVAIAVSSIIFGAAHLSGGLELSLLATLAGFGYGLINETNWGLRGAIAAHTALNAVHFLGFSYPALV